MQAYHIVVANASSSFLLLLLTILRLSSLRSVSVTEKPRVIQTIVYVLSSLCPFLFSLCRGLLHGCRAVR